MKSMDEKLMEPCRKLRPCAGDPWPVVPDHHGDTRGESVPVIRTSSMVLRSSMDGSVQRWWALTEAKNEPVEVP